ncbi:MAG: hypothetical protein DRJ03_18285 [Chloroflexi bacterium]|nr:MAG: hypothetical protein DRJ03_18285 [Chloroflexota bacterium]
MRKWKPVAEIKEELTLSVMPSGNTLVLYLPKRIAEVHEIHAGDRVKVRLLTHYKRDWERESDDRV